MPDLELVLLDEAGFDDIPDPAQPGARCQTCDYWERLDGGREAPAADAPDGTARASLKRRRLLAARDLSGSYAMLAYRTDAVARVAIGYAQFGPLSAYPRAQTIRDRYPQLPDSPAPWVVTCLQVTGPAEDRDPAGIELLNAVCDELDRRGIIAVEAYPEGVPDPWLPSPGPATVYEAAGFEHVAGDERFPVYRRELTGETDADAWSDLLRASEPDEGDDWPLPLPPKRRSRRPLPASGGRPEAPESVRRGLSPMLEAAFWGLVAASALVIGAAVGIWVPISRRIVALIMAFGSGALVSALAFDLTEEAFNQGGTGPTALGLALGGLTFFVGDLLIERGLGGSSGGRCEQRSRDRARRRSSTACPSRSSSAPR